MLRISSVVVPGRIHIAKLKAAAGDDSDLVETLDLMDSGFMSSSEVRPSADIENRSHSKRSAALNS